MNAGQLRAAVEASRALCDAADRAASDAYDRGHTRGAIDALIDATRALDGRLGFIEEYIIASHDSVVPAAEAPARTAPLAEPDTTVSITEADESTGHLVVLSVLDRNFPLGAGLVKELRPAGFVETLDDDSDGDADSWLTLRTDGHGDIRWTVENLGTHEKIHGALDRAAFFARLDQVLEGRI